MYVVQNDIVILSYAGPIEERKLFMQLKTVLAAKERIKNNHAIGFILSVKNAVYNLNTLLILTNQLKTFEKQMGLPIAIADYSAKAYETLKTFTKDSSIKLIGNSQAAQLFFGSKLSKKNISIMVYDEDEGDMDKICSHLIKNGYKVRRAKTKDDFNRESNQYDIAITQCCLNRETNKPEKNSGGALRLSKTLVTNLPLFVDTAVETLVSYTGMEAHKASHKIRAFDSELNGEFIIAMMEFSGDIDGKFILMFPHRVAYEVLEAMVGGDDQSQEALMDVIGELCNIITGSAKTKLSSNNIKVIFELPKKYDSLDSFCSNVNNTTQGVWIEMQLDEHPFYMFVTK